MGDGADLVDMLVPDLYDDSEEVGMTLQEFENIVRDAFPYGVEYADDVNYTFELDSDGNPEGTMTFQFSDKTYKRTLIIGESGDPVIMIDAWLELTLTQENIFASCLFEVEKQLSDMREENERLKLDLLVAYADCDRAIYDLAIKND